MNFSAAPAYTINGTSKKRIIYVIQQLISLMMDMRIVVQGLYITHLVRESKRGLSATHLPNFVEHRSMKEF